MQNTSFYNSKNIKTTKTKLLSKSSKYCLGIFFFIAFLYPAIACADTPGLKKTNVILLWKPQAQFAGFYVAKDKGIYEKYGLDVHFLENDCLTSSDALLESQKADFALMWLSSAISKRAEGLKLVNIAQIIQRSSLMLVAKKSSGIKKPQDLQNKKVSLWEGTLRLQPEAFFRKFNLKVKVIPQSYTVNLFLNDGVAAASAMWYNEYNTIINSGVNPEELVTFFFSDYGLNFPEDGIYTLENTLAQDRTKAEAFVKATMEGWQYSFAHPEEAVDIILKNMREGHLAANRVHQKWMLARMEDLITITENNHFADLKKDDYDQVSAELMTTGLIKKKPEFSNFFIPLGKK